MGLLLELLDILSAGAATQEDVTLGTCLEMALFLLTPLLFQCWGSNPGPWTH
jgi:hypothetical protein